MRIFDFKTIGHVCESFIAAAHFALRFCILLTRDDRCVERDAEAGGERPRDKLGLVEPTLAEAAAGEGDGQDDRARLPPSDAVAESGDTLGVIGEEISEEDAGIFNEFKFQAADEIFDRRGGVFRRRAEEERRFLVTDFLESGDARAAPAAEERLIQTYEPAAVGTENLVALRKPSAVEADVREEELKDGLEDHVSGVIASEALRARRSRIFVIPALASLKLRRSGEAGIQACPRASGGIHIPFFWIPVFAGMTRG